MRVATVGDSEAVGDLESVATGEGRIAIAARPRIVTDVDSLVEGHRRGRLIDGRCVAVGGWLLTGWCAVAVHRSSGGIGGVHQIAADRRCVVVACGGARSQRERSRRTGESGLVDPERGVVDDDVVQIRAARVGHDEAVGDRRASTSPSEFTARARGSAVIAEIHGLGHLDRGIGCFHRGRVAVDCVIDVGEIVTSCIGRIGCHGRRVQQGLTGVHLVEAGLEVERL